FLEQQAERVKKAVEAESAASEAPADLDPTLRQLWTRLLQARERLRRKQLMPRLGDTDGRFTFSQDPPAFRFQPRWLPPWATGSRVDVSLPLARWSRDPLKPLCTCGDGDGGDDGFDYDADPDEPQPSECRHALALMDS